MRDSKRPCVLPCLWLPCLTLALSAACSNGTSLATLEDSAAGLTDAGAPLDGRSGTHDATAGRVDGSGRGPHDGSLPTSDSGPIADTGVDACLGSGSVSARRPRVFMAFSNFLGGADAAVDNQWTYVREHLDGIWGNNGDGIDAGTERQLWNKVKTRTLITEWGVPSLYDGSWSPPSIFSFAQANGGPNICRQAIAIQGSPDAGWEGFTVANANAVYVTNPDAAPWQRYHAVYTEWQPQAFNDGGEPTDANLQAFEASTGADFECPLGACLGGAILNDAISLITKVHAKGDPFIWFASNNLGDASAARSVDWPMTFKATYNLFAQLGLWQPNDVVMIINYNDWYPAVPETVDGGDANTVTGLAYWALHQTPIGSDP